MKFSRINKAEQLTRNFDESLQGTIYSALIAAVLEINDQYTDNKDYFYDSDNEKLITASGFIYTCGTDELAAILGRMEGQLGIKYEQGIEKLMDELIRLSKKVPMELLEDIPANFASSINFNLLTTFLGGTLKMRGMSRGISAAQSTGLYKKFIGTKTAAGQAVDNANKRVTEIAKERTEIKNKLNTVGDNVKVNFKEDTLKAQHRADGKAAANKWKQEQKKANAAKEAINNPSKSIPSTNVNQAKLTSEVNKPKPQNNPAGNSQQGQQQMKMEREAQKAKTQSPKPEAQQNSAQNRATKVSKEQAYADKLKKRDTTAAINKETEKLNKQLTENTNKAQEALLDKQLAESQYTKSDRAKDMLKGGVDAAANLVKMGGENYKQAALWGGAMDAGSELLSGSGRKAAQEITDEAAGKVVDTSKRLSKVNYR